MFSCCQMFPACACPNPKAKTPNTEMMEKLILICGLNLQSKSSAHSTWPHCHQTLQHFCDTAKESHKDKLRRKQLFRHVPKMLGQICVKTPEYFLPTHMLINHGQKVLVAKCTSPRQRWQVLHALACCGDRTLCLSMNLAQQC